MSIDRIIYLDLNVQLSENDIKSILQETQSSGCDLYKRNPKTHTKLSLSLDEMATIAFRGYNTPRASGGFYAHLDTTRFILSFFQNFRGTASIGLMLMRDYWKKEFIVDNEKEEKIDYARYVRFLMQIAHGLPVHSIKIFFT